MKKIVFLILVALSINSFAKDFKVGKNTICSGVESADKFKVLIGVGIAEEEAAAKIKGCKTINSNSKSYTVGSNTTCSDSKSKNAFETLLKVGYDENYAYKKVPNCHPINSNYQTNHENHEKRIIKKDGVKIYKFRGKEVFFRDSYYRALGGTVPNGCLKTLSNGQYYYYRVDRDRGNEVSFVMDERSPRQTNECPKYLIEKK